jgi:hypothetical protein
MTYWLGIVSQEVWTEVNQTYNPAGPRLYGFPRARRPSVKRMKVGDRIVEYMKKQKVFLAAWEITGGYVYVPDRKIAGKEFPECVEVKPIKRCSPDEGIQNNWNVRVRMSAIDLGDDVGEAIFNAL